MRKVRSRFNLRVYLEHHHHALVQGFRQLSRTPLASVMTITALSITIMLPSIFLILMVNAERLTQSWNYHTAIAVYLKTDTTPAQAKDVLNRIKTRTDVQTAEYISPKQGLQNFEQQTGFKEVLKALDKNPLPGVISLNPVKMDQLALQQLKTELTQLPYVDSVNLDMQWVQRLLSILSTAKQITYGLFFLLSLAALLIMGNTIRLALQRYQREMQVMDLLGASRSFIHRPFLYAGTLYGLTTGVIATFLLSVAVASIQSSVNQLMLQYHSQFQITGLDASAMLYLVLFTSVLGFLGAKIAIKQ